MILTVVKPVRITHLTVCLHGYVRVFKHPNEVNEPWTVDPSLGAGDPMKSQYFGNGHASLFQDEIALCGEGRLDAGVYEFNFELEFPSKGLPTSIDFERGTISYMITATVTRPTSIAATSSCDQKIALVETVDIGPLQAPKPRTISLEPISRKPRRKKTVKVKENGSQETNELSSGSEVTRPPGSPLPEDSASQCGSLDHTVNPQSPSRSDAQSIHSAATSADSTVSSSTGLSFRLGPAPSAKSVRDSAGNGSRVSLSEKTITATIELQKSGCLPGENLPLKISIKHTKAIKSMHGIIITLYRQGRIDSAPPLSLFADIKGKAAERLKHEEYYPKSKTGLGGLSLTSAGSSSIFRKDLAQTFAPILVDPHTLTAEISASVRIPEDVFPTISGVPGQMISFKYLVEVVVDLGGKLAGQQRHVPRVGAMSNYGTAGGGRLDGNPNMLAAWGGSIVDTDHIRREKSVVACVFEVVVGSTDTARRRGRGNGTAHRQGTEYSMTSPSSAAPRQESAFGEAFSPGNGAHHGQDMENPYPYPYDEEYQEYYSPTDYDYSQSYYPEPYQQPSHAQIPVPVPDLSSEEGVSEKERIRRAEERLLPSQPPPDFDEQGPSSARTATAPTAPSSHPAEPLEDLYNADNETPHAAPPLPFPPAQNFSAPPLGPSAPHLEDFTFSPSGPALDDKQELERRRLQSEASAPSDVLPDDDDNAGEGSSRPQYEPTAPTLNEEDEYRLHYHHNDPPGPSTHHETLPKYER